MNIHSILNDSDVVEEPMSASAGVSSGAGRKRGVSWEAWEDRALSRQVIADDPILNNTGKKEERWKEVAEHLKKLVGMNRSWSSCKNRMDKLVEWQRVSVSISD